MLPLVVGLWVEAVFLVATRVALAFQAAIW